MWMKARWLERGRTCLPCGKKDENVDLDEPTALLDHVYLGCTQRGRKPNGIIIETHMFESRISAGATVPGVGKLHAQTVAWPTTWKDRLEILLKDTANWRTTKNRAVEKSLDSLLG